MCGELVYRMPATPWDEDSHYPWRKGYTGAGARYARDSHAGVRYAHRFADTRAVTVRVTRAQLDEAAGAALIFTATWTGAGS